jgi:hypothetical protein
VYRRLKMRRLVLWERRIAKGHSTSIEGVR